MKRMMKHLSAVLLALVVVFGLQSQVHAEQYAPAVFKTTPFQAVQNDIVETTLYLEAGSNLIDFEFRLNYDPEMVTLQKAERLMGEPDPTLPSDFPLEVKVDKENANIHVSYTNVTENLTAKTDFVKLTFKINDNAGSGSYNFLTLDADYHSEAHTMRGGNLFVLPMSTEFSTLELYDVGDIGMDHKVSISDVTSLRQYLVEMTTLTQYQMNLANARHDGTVDLYDAIRIQQHLADQSILLGNRVKITFLDKEGKVYRVRSAVFGQSMTALPALPDYPGYFGGLWSDKPDVAAGSSFQDLRADKTVYAVYKKDASPAVTFYKERLREMYYAQDVLTGNMNLIDRMAYQGGYTADLYWSSSDSAVLNASTGKFNKPAYDTTVTLTATIISRQDGVIEAQDYVAFEYQVKGEYLCPTKAEIRAFLAPMLDGSVDYDMILPSKVTNNDIKTDYKFEVRLDWFQRSADGTEKPVKKISRVNSSQKITLVAVASFNGTPLEDDGKLYFDDVTLNPVSVSEIRNHIISEIAAHTGRSVSTGEEMWHQDTVYNTTIKWISGNNKVATVANNIVTVKDKNVVNGTALPLDVEVTYQIGGKTDTFRLSYTVSVVADNALLVPGTNIDPYLYNALKNATGAYGNLTTNALKDVKFVSLDLSGYPEIKDLHALTYCTNLRVLNISGLKVDETSLNQIATLNKLEVLIANNCGLTSLSVGGVPLMDKMINLKMLDLSNNNLTSLSSILSVNKRYGQMEELYLHNNQLTDISALCDMTERTTYIYNSAGEVIDKATEIVATNRAPMLRFLTLDNNHLTDEDIVAFQNFKMLKYLSLGNNEITSVTPLKGIAGLLELHLQGNRIEDVRDLRFLRHLEILYLSNNRLRNVYAGANEVNISYLRYLPNLEILYLDNNDIEDIDDLYTLDKLKVLNVNNNRIQSLAVLADKGKTMVELYAEHNQVDSFSFLRNLTNLKRLMLSDNNGVYESALPGYLTNLTKLQTLTLSGKNLRSLAFLQNMTDLIRLDVANCNLPSYNIQGYTMDSTTMKAKVGSDNIAAILSLKDHLAYLDVSNNGLAYGPAGMKEYLASMGVREDIKDIVFQDGKPAPFDTLYEMSNLKVLYADNLCDPVNAPHLFSVMTGINYLSMENCGITDASWLENFRGLIYVNLAGNKLSEFDLGNFISIRSRGTLEYLYIDSTTACEFANAYSTFDGNVLKEFAASNVKVNVMDYLPDMENLNALNLSNSGITNLIGENPDFDGWFNLSRYKNLTRLDLSGVQSDLAEVEKLAKLKEFRAVGTPDQLVFYRQNLETLYRLHNKGVVCYLYDQNEIYKPDSKREGGKVLNLIDDFSRPITVAADGVISDNNPVLPLKINNFDITWSVSNPTNYKVVGDKLTVLSYENIQDEKLTLTASINVYPGQAPATRTFTLDTTILRADTPYFEVTAIDAADYLVRGAQFTYGVACKAAPTEGFSQPVKPVCTEVRYDYKANLSTGEETPYFAILDVAHAPAYTVDQGATLGASVTIYAKAGHTVNGEFLVDKTIEKVIRISDRIFTLNYVANGGSVVSTVDGREITSEQYAEESVLFEKVQVKRDGYTFGGWFTNPELTVPFEGTTMPSNDLTLYAKWNINTYTVTFESNGGSSVDAQQVPYGSMASEPSAPTRENYRFQGWFKDQECTQAWSFSDPINGNTTLYAKWIYNIYTVTFDANGGTGSTTVEAFYNSTVSAPSVNRTGYSLVGWAKDPEGTEVWDFATEVIKHDQTLYAIWTVNQYLVSFDGNGGNPSFGSKTVSYASNYGSLPSASRTGYNFLGWYSAPDGGTRITDSTKVSTASNHTLYARWEIIRVDIPNFSGQSVDYAKNWCNQNGIRYTVSYQWNWQNASGTCLSNTYAGSRVDYGTQIAIYASQGAKPYAVGDRVWYDGGWYTTQSNGNGSKGQRGAQMVTIKYIAGNAVRPYNINGWGWVYGSQIYQRTN